MLSQLLALSLNWTVLVKVWIIAIIPLVLAVLISFNYYFKKKYTFLLFMAIGWAFMMLWGIGQMLADLLTLPGVTEIEGTQNQLAFDFKLASNIMAGICGIFLIMTVDLINKERIEALRLLLMSSLMIIIIFTGYDPGAIYPGQRDSGEWSMKSGGSFKVAGILLMLNLGLTLLVFFWRIYKASPPNIKQIALINLIGAFLLGVVTILFYILGLSETLPGFNNVIMAIGILMISYAFGKEPKLAFILPFKAVRLMAIQSKTSIPIYTHTWNASEELADPMLFSGMLQGVSLVAEEALRKGQLRELMLDEATLIVHRDTNYPIIYVLIADVSTRSLRNAFETYSTKFTEKHCKDFEDNYVEISMFEKTGENLIQECFPFVPQYD